MATFAYQGIEPYIFISYAHKDSGVVLPIIKSLNEAGFLVWYDEGIEAGTEWPEFVAKRLYQSSVVIAFISNAALDSQNCRREINFAISKKKEMLTVYIENVELSLGMEMQLGTTQAMFYTRMSYETFLKNLTSSDILKPCYNEALAASCSKQEEEPASPISDFKIENGSLKKYIGNSTSVIIPDGVTSIGAQAFNGSSTVESIKIPDSVRIIGSSAFCGCSKLKDINLPMGITSIGRSVFEGCESLESISIPDGVTSIGERAFCDCTKLTSVSLPETLTDIGDQSFTYCESLENLFLSSGVKSIGIQAFDNCKKLSLVLIPYSVEKIDKWAFIDCPSLTILCEAMFEPDSWDDNWNPDKRPVNWRYQPFSI